MVSPQDMRNGPPSFHATRGEQKTGAREGIRPVIVLLIILGVFVIAGFLWVYFYPIVKKKKLQPTPVDSEDAYFLDENKKLSFPPYTYDVKPLPYNYRDYRSSTAKSLSSNVFAQWSKPQSAWAANGVDSFIPPPPAYSVRATLPSTRTAPSPIQTIPLSSLPRTLSKPKSRARRRSTIPMIKITRTPSTRTLPNTTSYPDAPGPRMPMDRELRNGLDITFRRPSAEPSEAVPSSVNHPSPVYLPTPSKTVVHANNDHINLDVCSTPHDDHDSNSRSSLNGRFSHFFAEWDRDDYSVTSTTSQIGIAI